MKKTIKSVCERALSELHKTNRKSDFTHQACTQSLGKISQHTPVYACNTISQISRVEIFTFLPPPPPLLTSSRVSHIRIHTCKPENITFNISERRGIKEASEQGHARGSERRKMIYVTPLRVF